MCSKEPARTDNSESVCQLEEYDALVERLRHGDKLEDVPIEKRALAMGLKKAREDVARAYRKSKEG